MRIFLILPFYAHSFYEENILIERLFSGYKLALRNTANCKRQYENFEVEDVPDSCVEYVKDEIAAYNRFSRPVFDIKDSVNVTMSVTLLQLVELNEPKQFLTTSVMFNIRWKDEYLAWRPSLNSNITSLVIPSSKIWKPDILLYQSIKEQFDKKSNQEGFDFDNIVVDNFGNCSWMPPDKLKSSCQLDMEYFPYDTQVCELKFGSWSYRKHLLRLNMETRENKHGEVMAIHIDQNQFINSTAWEIIKTEGILSIFECFPIIF
jgi:hypothetical protein